jgi:hypothetical protein
MEELIHELHLQNLNKDEQIATLEAQLNAPPPPPVAEESDQDTGNVVLTAAVKEEEDPEEVLSEESIEGEVTPVANDHAMKRKREEE